VGEIRGHINRFLVTQAALGQWKALVKVLRLTKAAAV
jgi:hypothetical protein